jgi:uncharacterized membrane protein
MTTLQIDRYRAPARRTGRRRRLGRLLSRPGWVVMTVLSLTVLPFVWHYLAFDPSSYFAEQREVYVRREFVLGVHVLSGMLAITIGPFQFVSRLRRRFLAVHRALGVVYIAAATGVGLTGLVLATSGYGGLVARIGFGTQSLAILYTTWTALRMIFARRIGDHRRWMIRSFSIMFAGVMLRLMVLAYYTLSEAGLVGFSFEQAYAAIAWLDWVPNLLLAVWLTRRPSRRSRSLV